MLKVLNRPHLSDRKIDTFFPTVISYLPVKRPLISDISSWIQDNRIVRIPELPESLISDLKFLNINIPNMYSLLDIQVESVNLNNVTMDMKKLDSVIPFDPIAFNIGSARSLVDLIGLLLDMLNISEAKILASQDHIFLLSDNVTIFTKDNHDQAILITGNEYMIRNRNTLLKRNTRYIEVSVISRDDTVSLTKYFDMPYMEKTISIKEYQYEYGYYTDTQSRSYKKYNFFTGKTEKHIIKTPNEGGFLSYIYDLVTGSDGTPQESKKLLDEAPSGKKELYHEENKKVITDTVSLRDDDPRRVTGWKIAKLHNGDWCVIKLSIPPDARIVTPIDEYFAKFHKRRCSYAYVVDIQKPIIDREESTLEDEAISGIHVDSQIIYKKGEIVRPDGFDQDNSNSCSQGIHFHIERNYVFSWIPEYQGKIKLEKIE